MCLLRGTGRTFMFCFLPSTFTAVNVLLPLSQNTTGWHNVQADGGLFIRHNDGFSINMVNIWLLLIPARVDPGGRAV
jgi:hypothetical protein